MAFEISYLADRPEHLPVLAEWQHAQWRHLNPPDYSLAQREAEYQAALQRRAIPTLFVAHEAGQPLGSVRLVANDMDTHPEYTPWLASLYVHPDFRRRGAATALMARAVEEVRLLGLPALYLFTEDGEAFYAERGWAPLSRERYLGQAVVVMRRDVS